MQATIETKGFRPGAALNKFLSERVQSITELDKELIWTEFKLTFEDHYFHSNLCLIFADGELSIALCDKNLCDAVLNAINFAAGLLKVKRNVGAIKRKIRSKRYALPKHTSFQFSAN